MTPTSGFTTPADALPLLAYKIAPRQFDLSYRFSNISLRDQIVRAQTLVRTLVATKLIGGDSNRTVDFPLLICGAGAAGLAAAKEADALGIRFVLVEKENTVPGGILNSDADRYVSTAMYEWPHPNHTQHAYPLSAPALLGTDTGLLPSLVLKLDKAVLIADFGKVLGKALDTEIQKWTKSFTAFARHSNAKTWPSMLIQNVSIEETSKAELKKLVDMKVGIHGQPLADVELPRITLASSSGTTPDTMSPAILEGLSLQFAYVIYANGFPQEAVAYATEEDPVTKERQLKFPFPLYVHNHFWKKDTVFDARLGFSTGKPSVGILGSGDGALQDALRCLVSKHKHPLEIWDALMAYRADKSKALQYSAHVQKALARVAAADLYTTSGAVWHHGIQVFNSLDAAFKEIIQMLYAHESVKLDKAIDSLLRDDVGLVTLVTQHGYFTKAYALNRFLILLFHARFAREGAPTPKLEIISGTVKTFEQVGSGVRGAMFTVELNAKILTRTCDLVILRGGLERSNAPLQQAGLTGVDTGRAGLGRIPAPIRPVAI